MGRQLTWGIVEEEEEEEESRMESFLNVTLYAGKKEKKIKLRVRKEESEDKTPLVKKRERVFRLARREVS